MSQSIHPRAVDWKREGRLDSYVSQLGTVWRGAAGDWHGQAGSMPLDQDFRTWKAAAKAVENWYGRFSKATQKEKQ